MNNWTWIFALLLLIITGIVIFWNYKRTKKVMDTIERMLNTAMNGDFSEKTFDESRMSALETKFAQYISSSAVSARNVSAEKDKIKTLIADISHQTKTPISNILLYSELLKEEALSESAMGNVEALQAQTEKLHFLIDSLVKLSRLENGIVSLSPRHESVQPMLETVKEQFVTKAEAKGLFLHLEDTGASAYFDPKWMTEALCNIVDNAIKYTNHGGITISTVVYEMFVRIDVADSGIGICESEHAKIFSRFYRSEAVSDSEGVGIGLYLAREIVTNGGGYIKVNSACGKGSVFSVFLPG